MFITVHGSRKKLEQSLQHSLPHRFLVETFFLDIGFDDDLGQMVTCHTGQFPTYTSLRAAWGLRGGNFGWSSDDCTHNQRPRLWNSIESCFTNVATDFVGARRNKSKRNLDFWNLGSKTSISRIWAKCSACSGFCMHQDSFWAPYWLPPWTMELWPCQSGQNAQVDQIPDFEIARPPQQSRPLSPLHEPLHWRAKRDPKAKCILCSPFYGRACRWAMLGEIKTWRT